MNPRFFSLTLGCLGVLLTLASTVGAAEAEKSLVIDGLERSYLLHLPTGQEAGKTYPLVLAFHGGGANAESMVRMSGLSEKADVEGFIVAYPSGTGRLERMLTFNGGNCCGYAMLNEIDDVAFVSALIDELVEKQGADPKRVYATGMSNGGIISYRLADELADKIAAIAPVSGTMGMTECHPSRPVPVMHFHGTDDQFLNYEGGFGKRSVSKTNFHPVDYTIQAWVKANHAAPEPLIEDLPDIAEDGCTVQQITYPAQPGGAEVILVRIQNGGHTWPGSSFSPAFLGTQCRDISATDMMWEFFQRHTLE